MENKTSAKDFFLHLGAIVALYAVVISFLNLTFKIISKSFPEIANNIYAWGGGSEISMPVATLIIVFPLFVILSWLVHKIYTQNPIKKELGIRKWLTYITLFVAGIILAGDLITVLYKFLDGQDLTSAFLLKALVVLLVAGAVFGFYLQDIRDKISSRSRKILAISVAVIILISIILGFGILGSPQNQRLLRLDNQKISDLQGIQWQVINYWQMNGMIPESMPSLPIDIEYKKTNQMTFELCAQFNRESVVEQDPRAIDIGYPMKESLMQNNDWSHKAGYYCFERIIDPISYPTQVRG
ncbi:MAG: hypothetical protein UR80_C0012G0010 [Parcubacteria group bacterium GW2011_GWB1_35_5]|uniref:DUF5671 domain-containing protein n=1 Tax=Candidatus Zambryskibacteria bacterium RIFCSPLOWO2_01_FULL_35_19 TaxID=1802757 RepID=A0A1G2TYW8_9BACT|nr:MAG: hypothetical protein UR50_C0010G0017 [Parcubacteria group bacterium GW2011_GWC1_34_10]KKP80994.1 MAG: hypothetical protein UR80_C0012G0010 [Parcubacteria group bacterium GW2011_GWB1_35_5]OHB02506.1 MAG: hypothetical protein A3A90_01470 [Candidatus Zambryskibacteria bacterium RIFCSPLOWO2_01_FULL_35_19]